jgi:hypothetical protein
MINSLREVKSRHYPKLSQSMKVEVASRWPIILGFTRLRLAIANSSEGRCSGELAQVQCFD